MNRVITYSIAIAVVLAGLGVFYNFAVVQPGIERERLAAEQLARDAAETERKNSAAAIDAKEAQRKRDYQDCIDRTNAIMHSARTRQCLSIAQFQDANRQACLDKGGSPSHCAGYFPPLDASPFCILSANLLEANERFERKAKEECLEKAKAGL